MFDLLETTLILASHTDDGKLGVGLPFPCWLNRARIDYAAFSGAEIAIVEDLPKNILKFLVCMLQ